MRRLTTTLGSFALAASLACGASQVEQQAEETARGAEEAARGLEQMAKGLEQMAGGNSEFKPVPPVSFKELQTVFGDLSGWEKGSPSGEMMTLPVSFSSAEVTYSRGDAAIEAHVVDSGFQQLLMAPYALFLAGGYMKESADGWEKSTTVAGHPAFEKWSTSTRDGELVVVVAKRFLVTLEGRNLENPDALHQLAQATDLERLTAMK